jgi:hypothetical protein
MIALPLSSKIHCHHAFCFQVPFVPNMFKYKNCWRQIFVGVSFSSNHCIVQCPWGFFSIVSHDYEWASTWNDVHFSPNQLSIKELDFDKCLLNQVQFHSNSFFDLAFKCIWDRLLFDSSPCILLVLCHHLFQHLQLFVFVFQCFVVCDCAYVVLVCILNYEAKIGVNQKVDNEIQNPTCCNIIFQGEILMLND